MLERLVERARGITSHAGALIGTALATALLVASLASQATADRPTVRQGVAMEQPAAPALLGTWLNRGAISIRKAILSRCRAACRSAHPNTHGHLQVHLFGACQPPPGCDWGTVVTEGYTPRRNANSTAFIVHYDFGFAKKIVVGHLSLTDERLRKRRVLILETFSPYGRKDNRYDSFYVDHLSRRD